MGHPVYKMFHFKWYWIIS